KSHRAAIIIGGDGTFNAAVQGLWKNSSHQDHSVPIYAFPGGTANDLSAELGLQQSFRQLQDLIDHRRLSPMDVITCNGVPFTTVAGIGVGASITQRFNDIRQRSRVFRSLIRTLKTEVYTAMSANAIITTRSYLHDVAIESESFNKRMRIAALFVCNQNKLGGSLRVGQHNSNQDGIFGVLAVPADGPVSLLKTLLSIRSGQLPDHVISFSARELSVRSTEDRDIPVFGDGEILLRSRNLDFKIFPRSLMVYRDKAELN
ncbi:hypothetical protein EBZ37_05070, partial [bacterium]|nr:hypothetical protein [bacterium]